MIHVIATVELNAGTRERFLAEFARLTPQVRAEAGCIEYGAAVDVASGLAPQVPLRPEVVTIIEKWESLDALRAHAGAPHMGEYRARVKEFVIRTTLQVLEPAT
ncbi:MAG: antibiotic biosynthesis monooxygenase [Betaproteobacteria bacterium]|nr:antibiotic biosynthesis monooxygenase [Betaproteobacteria bacterium]